MSANDLLITGESYAGKYIPHIVGALLDYNKEAEVKIPLAGALIGDGLFDLELQRTNVKVFPIATGYIADHGLAQYEAVD